MEFDETVGRTCCFTGHRELTDINICALRARLEGEVAALAENGYCFFCAGGALGFDTEAELAVLRVKEKYPHIKLILALPCEAQARLWSREDQIIYEDIKSKADRVVYTSQAYFRGCMHKRNRYLVDISDTCICFLRAQSGGTAYTAGYAKKKGKRVINIADIN